MTWIKYIILPPANLIIPGVTYGHTGHVRFLTIVENPAPQKQPAKPTQTTLKTKALTRRSVNIDKLQKQAETTQANKETLIISGGDGYEDFRSSSMTEDAGREDSTNHLLLWRVWTNFKAYRVNGFDQGRRKMPLLVSPNSPDGDTESFGIDVLFVFSNVILMSRWHWIKSLMLFKMFSNIIIPAFNLDRCTLI